MLMLLGTPLPQDVRDTPHWRCLSAPDPAALVAYARRAVEDDDTLRVSVWLWLIEQPSGDARSAPLSIVDRLSSQSETRYPPIHVRSRLPRSALDVNDAVFDAYNALARGHTAEQLVLLASPASTCSTACVDALLRAAPAFRALTESLPLPPPGDLIDTVLAGAHATHSQRLQIRALCVRHRALFGRWPTPNAAVAHDARTLISALHAALDAAPVHYR